MFQVGLVRYATGVVRKRTQLSWKGYVMQQGRLLREARMKRQKQQYFSIGRNGFEKKFANRRLCHEYKRYWRFQTVRREYGRHQLTLRQFFQFVRLRREAEAERAREIAAEAVNAESA